MNASSREIKLGLVTVFVALGALTWWGVQERLTEWKRLGTSLTDLEFDVKKGGRTAGKKPVLERQLEAMKATLPVHPPGLDLKTLMLQKVKQMADAHAVTLTSMKPREEKVSEKTGLCENTIDCAFEGEYAKLFHFFHGIESQGPVMSIRMATLRKETSPRPGPVRLRGTMLLEFAYVRGTPPDRPAPLVPPAPPPVTPPAPAPAPAVPPVADDMPEALEPGERVPAVPPPVPAPAAPGIAPSPAPPDSPTGAPSFPPAFPSRLRPGGSLTNRFPRIDRTGAIPPPSPPAAPSPAPPSPAAPSLPSPALPSP